MMEPPVPSIQSPALSALSTITLVFALLCYLAASVLYFLDVARSRGSAATGATDDIAPIHDQDAKIGATTGRRPFSASRLAPLLLGLGALSHAGYITLASFVAHVCPIHAVHFMLSVASLLAVTVYLLARRRFRIDALGLLVSPLGLAFLLGTFFLGKPGPEPKLSPLFIAAHVMANLLGVALFLLAGGAAALYLVQEKRLKQKKLMIRKGNLPALDTLDQAIHRFLIAGFPLLTLGILTGTLWARQLEMGNPNEVMRIIFGYATWLLIALVLLMRAALGWRGRRAAYGTLAGLACATAVLIIYLVRPASTVSGMGG